MTDQDTSSQDLEPGVHDQPGEDQSQVQQGQQQNLSGTMVIETDFQMQLINDMIQVMMQQLMQQGRLVMDKETMPKKHVFRKQGKGSPKSSKEKPKKLITFSIPESSSEVMIYENAVRNDMGKRTSSSSDDQIDTSDKLIEPPNEQVNEQINQLSQFLNVTAQRTLDHEIDTGSQDEPQPSTSGQGQITPQDRALELIKEAEMSKARIMDLRGKQNQSNMNLNSDLLHSVVVDEKYKVVASHVDRSTRKKVEMGEYVDFAKLIPTDKSNT